MKQKGAWSALPPRSTASRCRRPRSLCRTRSKRLPETPRELHAKVEDFNPGTKSEVLAITDDETKAIPLSRFSASIVLGGIGGRLRTQPINVSLAQIHLPGFSIRSVSPLDPSGWVRVGLERNPNAPQIAQTVPPRTSPPVVAVQSATITQPGGLPSATAGGQP